MSKIIKGRVFVLGNDIDTDQIIPAKYLVYSLEDKEERKKYGEYVLSGVPREQLGLPKGNISFVQQGNLTSQYSIIVAGKNFGCGSSREHAPAALQIAGLRCIVAPSYARIFYRNAIDGGFLIPIESDESLIEYFDTNDEAEINLNQQHIINLRTDQRHSIKGLGQVQAIIEAGGIFAYARNTGMLGRS